MMPNKSLGLLPGAEERETEYLKKYFGKGQFYFRQPFFNEFRKKRKNRENPKRKK